MVTGALQHTWNRSPRSRVTKPSIPSGLANWYRTRIAAPARYIDRRLRIIVKGQVCIQSPLRNHNEVEWMADPSEIGQRRELYPSLISVGLVSLHMERQRAHFVVQLSNWTHNTEIVNEQSKLVHIFKAAVTSYSVYRVHWWERWNQIKLMLPWIFLLTHRMPICDVVDESEIIHFVDSCFLYSFAYSRVELVSNLGRNLSTACFLERYAHFWKGIDKFLRRS